MLKKILLVLVLAVVAFIIVAALQPPEFRVERTASIAAPPAVVFAQVNDFHRWGEWSPWEKLDPAMQKTYGGPVAGTGATYHWAGNKQVGEGNMEILTSQPNDRVRINLEFLKPFAAKNITEFTFRPEGNQTLVTWSMTGPKNFLAKAMGIFLSMDKMIGGDFDKGLANLKSVSEASVKS